ncbi:hypothetical protein GRI40_08920 [Altererythrobacter aerius]|uniref:Uncharacterized protein n=1 Tax=Tsuneonella aeria TaxID=1837929 RepID=A0A6I4TE46_9SPHN|nr:hypothetical protein [Tsuneonella aeria]MXO75333.1 hypothetical protein [Tsuneonella aeria]
MAQDNDLRLNIRALAALGGASASWRSDLAELFSSDAPLEPWLRERLAAAFLNEKDTGARLNLANHDGDRRHQESVSARHDWMKIGRWISSRWAASGNKEQAIWDASEHFGISEGKGKKSIEYFQAAGPRIERALKTDAGTGLDRATIEQIYHALDSDPEDRTCFRQINRDLLRDLGLSQ